MSHPPSQQVSELLLKCKAGDRQSLEALLPLVYKELCAAAHAHSQRECLGHTLRTAAMVHEPYFCLVDQRLFQAQDRTHFAVVAAQLMRQILVDDARGHRPAKRGADRGVKLDVTLSVSEIRDADVVEVDEALKALARIDEPQSRFVELRFFGGLAAEEAADPLGISLSTAKRKWKVAKAGLVRQMKRGVHGQTGKVGKD